MVQVLLAVLIPAGLLALGAGAYWVWVYFGTNKPWEYGGGGDSGDTWGGV